MLGVTDPSQGGRTLVPDAGPLLDKDAVLDAVTGVTAGLAAEASWWPWFRMRSRKRES